MTLPRRRCAGTRMKPFAVIFALAMMVCPVVGQSAVDCPNDDTDLRGYTSLADLNSDMQTELDRIAAGGTPEESYTFTLCPNQAFDANAVTLLPVLSDSTFVCGAIGDPDDDCTLLGGEEQIRIEDSTINGYTLETLVFVGLSFADFSSDGGAMATSIAALASSTTTATFMNSRWSNFASDFVVRQANIETTATPMNVQIRGGSIRSGMAGAVFDNDGGFLTVSNMQVSDITSPSFMATANGGVSFLQNSIVTSSTMDQVTFTTAQGAQSVLNTTVTQMITMRDTFFVEDSGSSLMVTGSLISDNQIVSNTWAGYTVLRGATATVTGSTLSGNSGLEFGAAAGGEGSSLTMTDSIISGNTGSALLNITSAAILAITDAEVSLDRVEINDNTEVTGAILALFRALVSITQTCFQDGIGDFVIFVDNGSDFVANMNFISRETVSEFRCMTGDARLFKEGAGSGCFIGGTCNGECLDAAQEDVCPLRLAPTEAPTLGPTVDPNQTLNPTQAPPTVAPTSSNPPSTVPSSVPSEGAITLEPTVATEAPTSSAVPSAGPTAEPTSSPTDAPTIPATPVPTESPTVSAAPTTSLSPTQHESNSPSVILSGNPTAEPTISLAVTTPHPTFFQKGAGKKSKKGKKGSNKKGKSSKSSKSKGKGGKGGGKGGKGSDKGGKGAGKGGKGEARKPHRYGSYGKRDLAEMKDLGERSVEQQIFVQNLKR